MKVVVEKNVLKCFSILVISASVNMCLVGLDHSASMIATFLIQQTGNLVGVALVVCITSQKGMYCNLQK